jgi:DNA-binding transcriptional LysR family regulator
MVMRLEWIEDLLAIVRAGSLNRAAERRFLTQPAFSRRIKSIEEYVGVELLDRTRKPAQLRPAILDQQSRLEGLAAELHELVDMLRQNERQAANRIVIACQHAITASVAPQVVKNIDHNADIRVRLRSENRAECFALLITKQADLTLTYRSPDEKLPIDAEFLEEKPLGEDVLVPVFAREHMHLIETGYQKAELPVIVYPSDVFLGEVLGREILPKLRSVAVTRERAETALTLAALQLALAGVGVAWVPRSLATPHINAGSLAELEEPFGRITLQIGAVRLAGAKSAAEEHVWRVIDESGSV